MCIHNAPIYIVRNNIVRMGRYNKAKGTIVEWYWYTYLPAEAEKPRPRLFVIRHYYERSGRSAMCVGLVAETHANDFRRIKRYYLVASAAVLHYHIIISIRLHGCR